MTATTEDATRARADLTIHDTQKIRRAAVRLVEAALELMTRPEDLEARGTIEATARRVYEEAAGIFVLVEGRGRGAAP